MKKIKFEVWNSNIYDWENIDIETLTLIYNESQKKLQSTIDTYDNNTQRFELFIRLNTILTTALAAYIIGGDIKQLLFISSVTLIISLSIYVIAFLGIKAYDVKTMGSDPEDNLLPDILQHAKSKLVLMLGMVELYQSRCNYNNDINYQRNRYLSYIRYLIALIPLSFIAAIFI